MRRDSLEEFYFWAFRGLLPEFPAGTVDFEGEAPDVRLLIASRTIGIEISKLPIRDHREDGVLAERDHVLALARSSAIERDLPNLIVHVQFRHGFPKGSRSSVADELLAIVEKHIPGPASFVRLERDTPPDVINSGMIDQLTIYRPPNLDTHLWMRSEIGIVQDSFGPQLLRHVARKQGKLPEYLKRCDECWLLLVADNRMPPDAIQFHDESRQETIASGFSRIFVLDLGGHKLYEIRTSPAN